MACEQWYQALGAHVLPLNMFQRCVYFLVGYTSALPKRVHEYAWTMFDQMIWRSAPKSRAALMRVPDAQASAAHSSRCCSRRSSLILWPSQVQRYSITQHISCQRMPGAKNKQSGCWTCRYVVSQYGLKPFKSRASGEDIFWRKKLTYIIYIFRYKEPIKERDSVL
jgi:hypothetical protein